MLPDGTRNTFATEEIARQYNARLDAPSPRTAANGFGTDIQPASQYDQLMEERYRETAAPINRDQIRKQKVAQFQAEIDATNQIYTNLVAKAEVEGQGRLGQQRALAARSGNLDSQRGASQQAGVAEYNRGVTGEIGARQQLAVSGIMNDARQSADQEIKEREAARRQGQDQYLEYLAGAEERKGKNASAVLQGLIQQGLSIEDIAPEDFFDIAKSLRMNPYELSMVYNGELAKSKAAADGVEYERYKDDREFGLKEGELGLKAGEFELNQEKFDAELNLKYQELNRLMGNDRLDAAVKETEIQKKLAEIQKLNIENGTAQGATEGGVTRVSPKEAQQLNQQIAGSDSYKAVIKSQDAMRVVEAFEQAWKDAGQPNGLLAGKKSQVTPSYRAAVLTLKEFFNLGVLNGPDLEQIEGILMNPFSLGTSAKNMFPQKAIQESIDNIKGMIKNQTEDRYNDVASQYQGYDPAQVTNLQQLGRIRSQVTGKQDLSNPDIQDQLLNDFGGSEGTNPKAPGTARPSSRSLDTKTLATAVLPKYPAGAKGGQCITFLHKLADFPAIGDARQQKFASVDKFGIPRSRVPSQARVGMILITDENARYGHGAMVNAISADGRYARVTESNYKGVEKVSHDRVIALDSPRIYGAIQPKALKPQIA